MNFVITGASGHIGNNLVRMTEKRIPDIKVTALLRRNDCKELEGTRCEKVVGDICDREFLSENITGDDVVICLAAFIDLTDKKYGEMYKVNCLAAKTLCDVCLEKRARFIYVGSVDAISGGDGKISEPENYYPEKIKGGYGQTKAEASKYILGKIRENPDFSAAMVLPSAVIGINDFKPSAVGKVVCNVILRKPEFGIHGGYNFVDVSDVCKAILTLSFGKERGQYIISGENVTVETLYRKLNALSKRKTRPIILPTFLVVPFLPFTKVLNKITLKSLSEPHDYSCEKAKRELGFSPTPLDETLAETVKWFTSALDKKSLS